MRSKHHSSVNRVSSHCSSNKSRSVTWGVVMWLVVGSDLAMAFFFLTLLDPFVVASKSADLDAGGSSSFSNKSFSAM